MRWVAVLVTAVAVTAVAVALGSSAGSRQAAAQPVYAGQLPTGGVSFAKPAARPRTITASKRLRVARVRWRRWGSRVAKGRGVVRARGSRARPRGEVRLWRLRAGTCAGAPARFYTRARVTYRRQGRRPFRRVLRLVPRCAAAPVPLPGQPGFPIRAAFYYPWFPETTFGHYTPEPLGRYDSSRTATVDQHVRALDHGRIEAGIASWWGPGTHDEARRIPLLLDRTRALGSSLKWTLYHEQEGSGDPSVDALRADLSHIGRYASHPSYLRIGGKPVIFVYNANDTSCEVADRWAQASAGRFYVVLKVFSGFASCSSQPQSWHQYGPATRAQDHLPHSFTVSPGFFKHDETAPRLARDVDAFAQAVRDQVASGARWQLVTTFNEWGEGTAVEGAGQWSSPSGFGDYLDVLHDNGRIASSRAAPSRPIARPRAEPARLAAAPAAGPSSAALASAPASSASVLSGDPQPSLPVRAAFYYPWFPEAWIQQGFNPFTMYSPSLGFYDSASSAVIAQHVQALEYGGVDVGISSWWGQGHRTDNRLPAVLSTTTALGSPLRWAAYYERESLVDPTVPELVADLTYLRDRYGSDPSYFRIDGRFVVFVYANPADTCSMAERWTQANATIGAHLVLKVFPGYLQCPFQPESWHQYAPAVAADSRPGHSYNISPGFFKPGEPEPRLPRDLSRWRQNIRDMIASAAPFQLVTSFNEWGEGTPVESAVQWQSQSGYGDYLDALHDDGREANLSLVMQESGDPIGPGQTLTYTLTATNAGPSAATGVTLADQLPSGATFAQARPSQGTCGEAAGTVTCQLGGLAPDGSASVEIDVTAPADGTLESSAAVHANELDPDASNNDASATTAVLPVADLALTSTDTPDPVNRDGTLTYALDVTNNGSFPAEGVTLTDDLAGGARFQSATASQGSCAGPSSQPSIFTPVADAFVDASTPALNMGTAHRLRTDGSPDTRSYMRFNLTGLSGAATRATLRVFAYSANLAGYDVNGVADNGWSETALTYANRPAAGPVVQSTGPVGAGAWTELDVTSLVSGDGLLSLALTSTNATATSLASREAVSTAPRLEVQTQPAGPVSCDLGTIAPGAGATVSLVVKPAYEGTLANSAEVHSSTVEGDPSDNVAAAATTVDGGADLLVTNSDSPDPVPVGQPLTYSATVTNEGPGAATGAVLEERLAAGMSFGSANPSQGACTEASAVVSCALGSLATGASATIRITAYPSATGINRTTAGLRGGEPDLDPSDNGVTTSTTVAASPLDHPRAASSLAVSLVPAFRQTIGASQCSARGGSTSQHGAPLAFAACDPPGYVAGTAARMGPQAGGSATLAAVPGNLATAADEADLSFALHLGDVRAAGGGGAYARNAGGPDVSLLARLQLSDIENGAALADAATTTSFELPVTADCAGGAAGVGSTCSVSTGADAIMPGAIEERRSMVIQAFRVRVNDSGLNGVPGDGDDRVFAQQGIFVP